VTERDHLTQQQWDDMIAEVREKNAPAKRIGGLTRADWADCLLPERLVDGGYEYVGYDAFSALIDSAFGKD
jgi:hypothetical protein